MSQRPPDSVRRPWVNSAVAAASDRRPRSEIDATIYVAQSSLGDRSSVSPHNSLESSSQTLLHRNSPDPRNDLERNPQSELRCFLFIHIVA